MSTRVTHWIDGRLWQGTPERSGDVYDPATGKVTKTVDFASRDVLDDAVAVAKAAFPAWRDASLTRRAQVLFAFRELLNANKEKVAALITEEHGKVLSDALGEVTRGLEVVEFACGIPHLLKGGFSEGVSTGVDVYSIRQPLGVVGLHQQARGGVIDDLRGSVHGRGHHGRNEDAAQGWILLRN
jgi:malonate-semialdehyde dehydrogenase (acetylating)/methylmalonate-semialdehyde dehydrogenase